jgi:hypothetical protein
MLMAISLDEIFKTEMLLVDRLFCRCALNPSSEGFRFDALILRQYSKNECNGDIFCLSGGLGNLLLLFKIIIS